MTTGWHNHQGVSETLKTYGVICEQPLTKNSDEAGIPALSAQGDAVQHPGPLDVDGGDGPDYGHPRHCPHQPVHLHVDY